MHPHIYTFCLGFIHHTLYTFITIPGKRRIPIKVSPVTKRAAMINILEACYLSLIQYHIQIVFRKIRNQIRLHCCSGGFPPLAIK